MKNNREDAMESLCEGLANKPVSFTAYHGGVEPDMTPDEGRAFYLTDDYDLAHLFARREVYDDGLYEGEIPTIFTYKGTFNNPYFLTDDEYDSEGQDSNIDYEKWVEMGVDGLVYEGQGGSTYYIVIDLSTIKLVDKKVYWEEEIKDDELDESKQHDLSDKSNMADSLRCLQIWADHNEGMEAINIIPPARAWEGLSDKQKKDIIKQHDGAFEYWDGDTTADWVANELEKNGFSSDYDSKSCDGFRDKLYEDIGFDIFDVLLESNILTEDIEAVKKYFPKVPEEKIQTLIELDPTYQGGDNLGKFGKWILGLYNKGQLKDEDFYKVPQYLTTFKDNLKKIQNKDIMSYKTLPDLAQAIQPYEGQKDVSKKQQVKQLKSDEAEKVLETGNWLIVHPKTHKADCYYGANTKWCTASKDDDTWFDEYNDKGPLFILINKNNNEKFQFHFESLSFMDELDKPEFPQLIISNDSEVVKWFKQYAFENIDNIIEEYNEDNWDDIVFGGSTGYAYRVDITDILNFCVQFSESNLALKKIITMFYEELELEGFGSKLIYKLFESDEEFKDKCDKLVAEYSPHDYFIKTYHYKTTGLFTDKDFRQMLFRKLRDSVYNDLARPLLDKIINEIVEIDEDDDSFYVEFDENELVNSLYQRGDFRNCKEKLRISSEGNRVNFSDLGITTDDFLKDTVIKAIKEYFEGNDDQMEFDFAAESVMKYKNPFLED